MYFPYYRAKWVKYNGTTLTKDYVVITNVIDEYEPEFAWINEITVSEQQLVILSVTKCETICYNSHYHSWEIQKTLDKSVMYAQTSQPDNYYFQDMPILIPNLLH